MEKDYLILKRASASRDDDDFDVLGDGVVVGRIMKVHAAPVGSPWMWTLMVGYEDRTPTHGYAETRETAMAHSPRAGDGDSDIRARQAGSD
jgi:hypothetical protein